MDPIQAKYPRIPSYFIALFPYSVSSIQFNCPVVSHSLRPHESQHSRPPCPSATPVSLHSDSRPASQWCHPTISSSVVPFSSCPQSLPASESFPMSQLFIWDGQSTGASALPFYLSFKEGEMHSPTDFTVSRRTSKGDISSKSLL